MPPGESRIGSDAACQVCIRGEGVLPIHAYLGTDGERLLIRPAAAKGSSSSEPSVGGITVNGEVLSGPITLSSSAAIVIGGVALRLTVHKPPPMRRLWAQRWFRASTWVMAALLLVVVVAYGVLRWVILDEKRLRAKLAQNIQELLLRDTDDASIQVKPFEGLITLGNVRFRERDSAAGSQTTFLSVPSATISFDVWPWLRSWQREYRNLRIVINNPELRLERSKADGSLNIRDILAKYAQGAARLDLGLTELDATVEIRGGMVRFCDNFTNIGETRLENVNIALRQPGQGKPLEIKLCEMNVTATPAPPATGTLALSGKLALLDAASVIDTANFSAQDLKLTMSDLDLARIFEHLGYAWEPYGMGFKVVLGKPITGRADISVQDIRNVRLNGSVESASLVSIREEGRQPLGNTRMRLTFDLQLADSGSGYLPHKMDVGLSSGADPNSPHLSFGAVGQLNPGGTSEYSVTLECNLQELFATDVAKRLDLDGRLGGRLHGNARLLGEADGSWKIDAKAESADAYAMVQHPTEPTLPPVRQPLPLLFEFHASADAALPGAIPDLVVESFKVRAPSFEAHSEVQGLIKGLNRRGELEARAKFKLGLKGREFWRDFKPILALFGFTQPVEEILDLEVTLVGRNDFIQLAAKGNAARQWNSDPAPVKLRTYIEFNRKAATPRAGAAAQPYLALMLEAASEESKPLRVRVDAFCRRTAQADVVSLESFADNDRAHTTPLPGLNIQSDIVALRERFKPYIEGYLRSHDRQRAAEGANWLKFYRDTSLTGEIEQSGRVVYQRMLDPKSAQPDQADFDLIIASKNLDAKLPLRADAATPWQWRENAVTVALKGSYAERLSGNKEEPDTQRADIEQLDVKGSVGAFLLRARNLDVFKLSHLQALPGQTWTDCLASLSMEGRLDPPAYDFARSLRFLPPDSPFCGTLALQIGFDRQQNSLALKKFEFRQAEATQNSFFNLDVAGAVTGVRDLSARLLPAGDDTPLGERVAAFIEEAGPAGLLDHLGDELTINSLQVETGPFLAWLCKDYKSGARQPPAFLAGLLRNDWQPEGTWSAAGVKLARLGEPKLRTWRLLGAKLRNDLTYFGAAAKAGAVRPSAFTMTHDWAFQLGASVDANNNVMLTGDIILDNAFLAAAFPALAYEYRKPAGEKSRLALDDCGFSWGRKWLAKVGKAQLTGKPVAFELRDFDADYARARNGVFQCAELVVNGGPLPCAITTAKFDPDGDSLQFRASAPAADLAYLAKLVPLPQGIAASGFLNDLNASYKGSLVALRATLEPDAAALAKLFPKLEPNDPRFLGLNPESDMLELDGAAQGLQFTARAPDGTRAEWRMDGRLRLTTRDLACKNLKLELTHEGRQGSLRQAAASSTLQINSADARLNLWRALRAPGMPANVNANLAFSTPANPAAWVAAYDTLTSAVAGPPAVAPVKPVARERRFAALEQLVASGTLQAPALQLGGAVFPSVEARDFSFKALKLTAPVLTTELCGGKLALNDTDFDLSKAVAVIAGDTLDLKGLSFRLRLKLTDADLARVLGAEAAKAPGGKPQAYVFNGRLDAQGNLDGANFGGVDRLTWDGAIKVKLSGLGCIAPRAAEASAPASSLPPWAAAFAPLPPRFAGAFAAAASIPTANIVDLAKDLPVADGAKAANGLALALQVYLARVCGVEVQQIEFEAITPTIVVNKGFATLDRLRLAGRGQCEGLDLEVSNLKINLADEAFADEAQIVLLGLPKTAQAALNLERWPAAARDEYLRELKGGKLALRVRGRCGAPTVQFPWPDLHAIVRRALFGADRIADLTALEQARVHFFTAWGRLPQDIAAAAVTGDRLGVGLPATLTARNDGETIIDRVPGLPPSLMQCLEKTAPLVSPTESLTKLLFPEPVPPTPGNKGQPRGNGAK